MVDITDSDKQEIRKRVKKLLKRGIVSNSELKRKLKKQGYSTTRRFIKKTKLEIAQDLIKPKKNVLQEEILLPFKTVEKLIYPAIKKIEKKEALEPKTAQGYTFYTPPCPKCKRCFPISGQNPIESKICIECGFEFKRVLGTHEGVWIRLEPRTGQVERTNTKFM